VKAVVMLGFESRLQRFLCLNELYP